MSGGGRKILPVAGNDIFHCFASGTTFVGAFFEIVPIVALLETEIHADSRANGVVEIV